MKPADFESFLRPSANGCIEWAGVTLKSNGRESHRYGRFTKDGKKVLAHRYAYELAHGEIPSGMCVLHRCDNTKCCNPDHLFVGTHQDNMADMKSKGRHIRTPPKPISGEQSPVAKLSDKEVQEIVSRRIAGEKTASIAAAYGIHQSYVSRLARGIRRKGNQQ